MAAQCPRRHDRWSTSYLAPRKGTTDVFVYVVLVTYFTWDVFGFWKWHRGDGTERTGKRQTLQEPTRPAAVGTGEYLNEWTRPEEVGPSPANAKNRHAVMYIFCQTGR